MDVNKLYTILRDRLMVEGTPVKHFALFADHSNKDGEEPEYPTPAVFLLIDPAEEQSLGNGVQLSRVEFSLMIECEVYAETSSREPTDVQKASLDHFEVLNYVNSRVHKYRAEGLSTIGRISVNIGSVASNVVEHTLNFRCTMKDNTAKTLLEGKENVMLNKTLKLNDGNE